MITQRDMIELCNALEVDFILSNAEEVECLEANNPALLEAMQHLYELAVGNEPDGHV